MEKITEEHIKLLAKLNVLREHMELKPAESGVRRSIVARLSHLDIIELKGEKIAGNFEFTNEEAQNLYVAAYKEKKEQLNGKL